MTHQEFIDKMARNRKVYEFWSNECQDLTKVAKKFGLAKAVVASNAIDYYRRHQSDTIAPELGHLDHGEVCSLIGFVGGASKPGILDLFSKDTPFHKRPPRRWSMLHQPFMSKAFDALGIDHITIDGMEFVHWKYSER